MVYFHNPSTAFVRPSMNKNIPLPFTMHFWCAMIMCIEFNYETVVIDYN